MRIFRLFTLISLAAIGAYLAYRLISAPQVFGMNAGGSDFDVRRGALGYGAMLVGVGLGAGYRHVLKIKQVTSILGLFRKILYSTEFWLGLFGSPLVFALILQSTASLTTAGLVTIALQNGFCCSTLVTGILHEKPGVGGHGAQKGKPA